MGKAATNGVRTPAQNNKIWGLMAEWKGYARLDDEDLRPHLDQICEEVSGQRHTSRLTSEQAAEVIRRLSERVNAAKPAQPFVHWTQTEPARPVAAPKPTRKDVITPAMQKTLSGLYALAGMGTPEQQRGFSQRQVGRPWPQSKADADKIVEALKSIAMRKVDPADIKARVVKMVGAKKLDAWKANFIADLNNQFAQAEDPAAVLTPHKLAKVLECEAALQ